MDEQHAAAPAVDPRTLFSAQPPARIPFDPADLLDGRKPPALPYMPGPTVVVVREFDPASFLGERALRGAFNLSTVKPLVTTVGGVEMVTVPASAYADALRRIAAQELPPETIEQAGPVPDAAGMLDLLLSLHATDVVSIDQLVRATGLDHLALGDRIAAFGFMPSGLAAEVSEAHGAALDDGRETEAHDAAAEAAKPKRHPRKPDPSRPIPRNPV